MFEAAEVGRKLSKSDYKAQVPQLRSELLAVAAGAPPGRVVPGDRPVCRRRHRRQGRDGQPAQRVDGPALDRRRAATPTRRARSVSGRDCGATGATCRRTGASRSFSAPGTPRRSCDRVARRTTHGGVRLAARPGCRLRANADRRWRGDPEVLDAPEQEGAEEAAEGVREGSVATVARHQGAMEALGDVRQVRERRRSRHSPHQHRRGAVAHRRGRRRALPHGRRGDGASRRDSARHRAALPAGKSAAAAVRPRAGAAADGPVKAIRRVEREFNVLDNLDLSQKLSDDDFDKELAEQQAASICCSAGPTSTASRPSSCSRAGTPPARAARSAA